jgi:nitrogen-specific signal transduction histidine kinase
LFARGRFSCALIDLGLPDGSGLNLLGEFTREDPSLVAIVLTGDASAETVIDTLREGAFDYLTKPVNITTLRAAMARALSHHAVVRERAELFRLLLEEREQLRARVEAATQDIRQYATACETSNDRLRGVLRLTQLAAGYYTEEELLRSTFEELVKHVPLKCLIICDATREKVICTYTNEDAEIHFAGQDGALGVEDYASLLVEAEPELLLRAWVERNAGLDTSAMTPLVFRQTHRNKARYSVGFFMGPDQAEDEGVQEFLDMCARFLAFEWEQEKLLLQVAHHASLGNIGVELARNFIQPLTAIRTASDFVNEAVISPEAAEGMTIIRDNVERLRRQTQEFRNLSLLREDSVETVRLDEYIEQALEILSVAIQNRQVTIRRDFEEQCECVLLNGTTLARTFLDLILGALRAVDFGGEISLALRGADHDHMAFEMEHECGGGSTLPGVGFDRGNPGLQLAERTVHSCGGNMTVKRQKDQLCRLRIVLPRNATSLASAREERH